MIISYHGKQCFKLSLGDITIAVNPISKESKLPEKPAKFGADIAMITTNHPDYNGAEMVSYGGKELFQISGPGEYEIGDFYIQGFLTNAKIGDKEYINTIYTMVMDGIRIWFLGALTDTNLSKEILENIDEVDLLFLPIGDSTLGAVEAAKFAKKIFSPKAVIPMDYDGKADKSLSVFLKEMGYENAKAESKLTLKKKDLEGKSGEVLPLEIA